MITEQVFRYGDHRDDRQLQRGRAAFAGHSDNKYVMGQRNAMEWQHATK